jgi:hypothetical protein
MDFELIYYFGTNFILCAFLFLIVNCITIKQLKKYNEDMNKKLFTIHNIILEGMKISHYEQISLGSH